MGLNFGCLINNLKIKDETKRQKKKKKTGTHLFKAHRHVRMEISIFLFQAHYIQMVKLNLKQNKINEEKKWTRKICFVREIRKRKYIYVEQIVLVIIGRDRRIL